MKYLLTLNEVREGQRQRHDEKCENLGEKVTRDTENL